MKLPPPNIQVCAHVTEVVLQRERNSTNMPMITLLRHLFDFILRRHVSVQRQITFHSAIRIRAWHQGLFYQLSHPQLNTHIYTHRHAAPSES